MKRTNPFLCRDCNMNTDRKSEYYMVHDRVWRKAGSPDGMLCIGCLEARIGRFLNKYDFTDAFINVALIPRSRRLRARLESTD